MDETPRQLDLTSEPRTAAGAGDGSAGGFLGVTFECCRVYSRLYHNRAGDAYEGRCPKCMSFLKVGIGPGGSNQRFFSAS
ncbi:MAG: hypothetical protein AAFV43_15990 [Planctomycetota bacterium]